MVRRSWLCFHLRQGEVQDSTVEDKTSRWQGVGQKEIGRLFICSLQKKETWNKEKHSLHSSREFWWIFSSKEQSIHYHYNHIYSTRVRLSSSNWPGHAFSCTTYKDHCWGALPLSAAAQDGHHKGLKLLTGNCFDHSMEVYCSKYIYSDIFWAINFHFLTF